MWAFQSKNNLYKLKVKSIKEYKTRVIMGQTTWGVTIKSIKFNQKFVVKMKYYIQRLCIKYIIRHRDKGKKQDLLKAIHFMK
ncbi:MAG: hypothetical protein CM15mV127_160 [Caudoviricetes sp.]|nr:MAG: hypothetical protein CM15mV127_160 [Caudoviricetes sp.]